MSYRKMPFGKKAAAPVAKHEFSWGEANTVDGFAKAQNLYSEVQATKTSAQMPVRRWSEEDLRTEAKAAGFDSIESAFLAFLNGPAGSKWESFVSIRSQGRFVGQNFEATQGPVQLCLGGTKPVPGWTIVNALPLPGVDVVADIGNLTLWTNDSVDVVYMSHTVRFIFVTVWHGSRRLFVFDSI